MKEVPSVGGAKGIFDIFVPGAFLLLNLIGVIYIWLGIGDEVKKSLSAIGTHAIPSLAVIACFGYLLGVLFRLIKVRAADRWSGYCCLLISKLKQKDGSAFLEGFPYLMHIEKVVKNKLPKEAYQFYCDFWGQTPLSEEQNPIGGNREFFNYCKTIINSVDEQGAKEVYAQEAMTRYVASMFYALLASFVIVFIAAIKISSGGLWALASIYLFAIFIILRNLRFLRFKEVETVFATTMRNYYSDKWPKVRDEVKPEKSES